MEKNLQKRRVIRMLFEKQKIGNSFAWMIWDEDEGFESFEKAENVGWLWNEHFKYCDTELAKTIRKGKLVDFYEGKKAEIKVYEYCGLVIFDVYEKVSDSNEFCHWCEVAYVKEGEIEGTYHEGDGFTAGLTIKEGNNYYPAFARRFGDDLLVRYKIARYGDSEYSEVVIVRDNNE